MLSHIQFTGHFATNTVPTYAIFFYTENKQNYILIHFF